MSKTHWSSKFEIIDHYGIVEVPEFTGAACKGPGQGKGKYKHGVKDAVDCKTCIRMRDRLKAKLASNRSREGGSDGRSR